MMKNGLAILIAVLLVAALATAAYAERSPRIAVDNETAALLILGFGGYRDSYQPPGHFQPNWRGPEHGYQRGYCDGWCDHQRLSRPYRQRRCSSGGYYRHSYRPQPRTGFRIRIGDGYLEWWETDRGSRFGYDSDRLRYRSHDRDRYRHRY